MPNRSIGVCADGAARCPGRHRAPAHTKSKRVHSLLARGVAMMLLCAGAVAIAPPTQASTPMYIGAVGDVAPLADSINAPLGTHAYAHFQEKVPSGRMITVEADGSWANVAGASAGSALYDNIVRWARTLKSRPGRTMLAYHHEPEASSDGNLGGPSNFIAAWRRVVTIFRAQGVQNVVFTWQMTAWSFRTSPSDPRYAAKWYPGDAYVDNIGADAYNWYTCGHGKGRWTELKTLVDPVLAFARAHGKPASLPEFASFADLRRAQWLRNAHQYLVANRSVLSAAFYFQQFPTNSANSDCRWKLTTSAEFDAYHDTARDSAYFTT